MILNFLFWVITVFSVMTSIILFLWNQINSTCNTEEHTSASMTLLHNSKEQKNRLELNIHLIINNKFKDVLTLFNFYLLKEIEYSVNKLKKK